LSGGGGTRVYLIAQLLQSLNYEVVVYGFQFGDRLYPEPPANLAIHCIKGNQFPQFGRQAAKLVQSVQADLLYAIKPRFTSFGMGLLKRLFSPSTPLLLDIDDWEMSWFGGDQWRYRPSIKQFARDILKRDGSLRDPNCPVYLQLMESLIKSANAITVNTTFLQQRYGGTYLPNGKNIHIFDPQPYDAQICRQNLGLGDYRVIMFPGTVRPHKGVEDVLIALDRLQQPDLRLVVVGGRDIGDGYLEQLLKHWSQWLIHLPPQPLFAMPAVVAAAHLVIVPQRDNPTANAQFPIKLTDGMAMAKPIIATKVGDIPKILLDAGYLIDPGSPDQIAQHIQEIFQDYNQATLKGKLARDRCVNHYSLEAMGQILEQVLSKI